MALTPQQLDVYRTVVHPTMAPDDKSRAIDMAYGIGAPPPPLATDTRLAEGGPAADTPTVDNSWALDSGAVTPADAARSATASDAIMHPVIPPYVPPAPPAAGEPVATHGEAAPEGAAPAAEGEPAAEEETSTMKGIRALAGAAQVGTPRGTVAAHDQATATVHEAANAIPDAIKNKIAEDAAKEGALAIQQGEEAATAHTNAAISFDNMAHQARADAAKQAADEKAKTEHLAQMNTEFQQTVKDTAAKPGDFWSSKDTGHKILSFISAIMFGLAGDPKGLQDVIDRDLAKLATNREKTLNATQSKIADFRARLLSPEAQEAAQRAFAYQAAAADANALAEAAKAPEARMKGQQLAQGLQTQADAHFEEAARKEAGVDRTNIVHVAAHGTGGPTEDFYSFAKKMEGLHYSPDQIMAAWTHQKATGGDTETPEDAKRRVTFDGGKVGYVGNDAQTNDTQKLLNGISGLQSTYARMREFAKHGGHTLAGAERAALEADAAYAMQQLQAVAGGEGANKKVAGEMLEKAKALTGQGMLDRITSDASALAQVNEAYQLTENQKQTALGTLTPSPRTQPRGGKIQTLGKSKDDVHFKSE